MTYKTYEEYRNIDNPFFKQIPHDWNIFKLKYITSSLESGKRKDFDDTAYAFSLGGEHINWDGTLNLTNKRYISQEFYNSMNKGKIQENDVLLVKDGATIGKTAFVDNLTQKMAVNEHVFIVRHNNKVLPKLLYYLISSHIGFTQIKLTETGSAQGGISQDISDKVEFIIPSNLTIQKQMINYLDSKVTKIDATIVKNKELIDLLNEKRVALINQVVTKGLNPEVPMKDSGIEWIGKIPEHWDIMNLKRFSNKITQGPNPDLSSISDEKKYKILKTKDITDKEIKYESTDYISSKSYLPFSNFKLMNNDILVCIVGHGSIGKINIFREQDEEFIFTRAIGLLRPDTSIIEPYFVKYFFESKIGKELINSIIEGSTGQEVVKTSKLGSLNITYPTLNEQKAIVNYLNNENSKIYKTIDKITQNIGLLEEYKTSLIHHVVTGKIDVRGEEI